MGMRYIVFDPSLSLAQLILCLTLLIAFWKLLSSDTDHDRTYSVKYQLDTKDTPQLKPIAGTFNNFFRIVLIATYLTFIGLSLSADFPVFDEKGTFLFGGKIHFLAEYLRKTTDIFILQTLSVCTACLLSLYKRNKINDGLIFWGLVIFCLGIIVKVAVRYACYPIYHWVQLVELLLTGVLLILIPLFGIVIIKYIHKLTAFIRE